MSKPIFLMAFAQNDLSGVKVEANKIWTTVCSQTLIEGKKINKASTEQLASEILAAGQSLFMFHFGGHADTKRIVLDGFRDLDKIRLANLLLSRQYHQVQLMFLNGCLSYGHVGLLTARGVKAIIATNVKINDKEAAKLGDFFYQAFILHGYTLKAAFQFADAQVRGKNSFPVIVNPGEIDDNQPMPTSWTLFVHASFVQVLDWKLTDFITAAKMVIPSDVKTIVNQHLIKDELEEALKKMYQFKATDDVLQVQGQLANLRQDRLRGIITHEAATVRRNQIRDAILILSNNL